MSSVEPHALDADEFLDEVQSFEFWFGAVEGYLSDRPFGHSPDAIEDDLDPVRRDRGHLCGDHPAHGMTDQQRTVEFERVS